MHINPQQVQQDIANLLLQYPELAEDDVLRADMIEGATEAKELLSQIVRRIGERQSLANAAAEYAKEISERKARMERAVEALRTLAFKVMTAADLPKMELPEATLSIRKGTPKVVITDEAALPGACLKTTVTPDKMAIKEMITNGVSVPGASMSNGEPSLAIRIK
jgi:hypothetical protein